VGMCVLSRKEQYLTPPSSDPSCILFMSTLAEVWGTGNVLFTVDKDASWVAPLQGSRYGIPSTASHHHAACQSAYSQSCLKNFVCATSLVFILLSVGDPHVRAQEIEFEVGVGGGREWGGG
jgi:hypothetical protein